MRLIGFSETAASISTVTEHRRYTAQHARNTLLPLLGACDLLKEVGDDSSTLLTEEGEVVTESGVATVEIDVDKGVETAFMITADGEHLVSVDEIIDPSGDTVLRWSDWTSTNTNLTSAIYPSSSEMVLNWPVRAEDAKVTPGKWRWSSPL